MLLNERKGIIMIRVVHCKREKFDIYIGRQCKRNHWGNPASHMPNDNLAPVKVKTRKESVQYFKDWLDGKYPNIEPERRLWILENLDKLKDKTLACFCKPVKGFNGELLCHGQILGSIIDNVKPEEIA